MKKVKYINCTWENGVGWCIKWVCRHQCERSATVNVGINTACGLQYMWEITETAWESAGMLRRNWNSALQFPSEPPKPHGHPEAVANLNSHHSNNKRVLSLYGLFDEPIIYGKLSWNRTEDFFKVRHELCWLQYFICFTPLATPSIAIDFEADYYLENNLVHSHSDDLRP